MEQFFVNENVFFFNRDLAAAVSRRRQYQFDEMIYVVIMKTLMWPLLFVLSL